MPVPSDPGGELEAYQQTWRGPATGDRPEASQPEGGPAKKETGAGSLPPPSDLLRRGVDYWPAESTRLSAAFLP